MAADGSTGRTGGKGAAPAARGPRPLADIVAGALAPACRRRGFATVDLVAHWPDIVGPAYAGTTAPERLSWRRSPPGVGDDDHEPALLTIRCTGGVALRVTHELPQLVERINTFFGYRCVGRIRIVQLPVPRIERRRRPAPGPVTADQEREIARAAGGIEDEALRGAVERLGRAVAARAGAPITKS